MSNKLGLPIATFQTGPEETFLVGTKAQIETFANSLLNAVKNTSEEEFFGVTAQVNCLKKTILDSKGDFSFDHVVVVKSNEEKDEIFYRVQNT